MSFSGIGPYDISTELDPGVAAIIKTMDPDQFPVVNSLGDWPWEPAHSMSYTIWDNYPAVKEMTLNGAFDYSEDNTITVDADDEDAVMAGSIIRMGTGYYEVASVNTSTHVITLLGDAGSTAKAGTGADVADDGTVYVISRGTALIGEIPASSDLRDHLSTTIYMRKFVHTAYVALELKNAKGMKSMGSDFYTQAEIEAMEYNFQDLEQHCLEGYSQSGSSSVYSSCAGLRHLISNDVTTPDTTFDEDAWLASLGAAKDLGVVKSSSLVLYANTGLWNKLVKLYGSQFETPVRDPIFGLNMHYLNCILGIVRVIPVSGMSGYTGLLVDTKLAGILPWDGNQWQSTVQGTDGTSIETAFWGIYGVGIHRPLDRHAIISYTA